MLEAPTEGSSCLRSSHRQHSKSIGTNHFGLWNGYDWLICWRISSIGWVCSRNVCVWEIVCVCVCAFVPIFMFLRTPGNSSKFHLLDWRFWACFVWRTASSATILGVKTMWHFLLKSWKLTEISLNFQAAIVNYRPVFMHACPMDPSFPIPSPGGSSMVVMPLESWSNAFHRARQLPFLRETFPRDQTGMGNHVWKAATRLTVKLPKTGTWVANPISLGPKQSLI